MGYGRKGLEREYIRLRAGALSPPATSPWQPSVPSRTNASFLRPWLALPLPLTLTPPLSAISVARSPSSNHGRHFAPPSLGPRAARHPCRLQVPPAVHRPGEMIRKDKALTEILSSRNTKRNTWPSRGAPGSAAPYPPAVLSRAYRPPGGRGAYPGSRSAHA